jgi:hypothetical protein
MRRAHQGSPVPYTGIPAHVARVSVYGLLAKSRIRLLVHPGGALAGDMAWRRE